MTEEFKVGDVVALRSSHIRMTVVDVDVRAASDECVCVWFDVEQNIHHGRFPMAALVNLSGPIPNL